MKYTIICKPFEALTPKELYAILRLRNSVFIVEQNCVYQDADNKDLKCHHLMLWNNDMLVAYARLVPAGVSYNEMSIGRVVSDSVYRRTGAGKVLLRSAIDGCYELFGKSTIRISAQYYLKQFYESYGFVACSDVYDEDGLPHIEMYLKPDIQ